MPNPYVNKVTVNNSTVIDLTSDTVTPSVLMQGYTAHDASGASIVGTATGGVDIPSFEILWDSSYSSATVTCNKTFAECYALWNDGKSGASYHASADNPEDTWEENGVVTEMGGDSTHVDYVANGNYGPIFDLVYHSDGTINLVQPSSYAIELSVTQNGHYYPPSSGGVYTSVNVAVPSSTPSLQAKTATPTTSQQVITADSGYDGLSQVTVSAMPTGTAGTPTATKGTVSNHAVSVTPSVTNTTGYITGGTKTGTAVTVSASELVSGSRTITANGTGIDVTEYASVDVAVAGSGSSWTKVAEKTYTTSYTNTSGSTVETWQTGHSELWTSDKIVYVRIRDTAGKRKGYFYGSDTFFMNMYPKNGSTSTTSSTGTLIEIWSYTTGGQFANRYGYSTTGYGVYADTFSNSGDIRIRQRYNSTYSLTINGTYKVEVYLLDPAGGVPLFG